MDTVASLQQSLIALLNAIGKYKTEQKMGSIHVVRERAFVGIHLKKSYLGVNIVLNHPQASPAADSMQMVSANRFHHYYKITSKRELNKAFACLLQEAYDLAGPKK